MNVKHITQKKLYLKTTLHELWVSIKWYFIFRDRQARKNIKTEVQREQSRLLQDLKEHSRQWGPKLQSGELLIIKKSTNHPGIKPKQFLDMGIQQNKTNQRKFDKMI